MYRTLDKLFSIAFWFTVVLFIVCACHMTGVTPNQLVNLIIAAIGG